MLNSVRYLGAVSLCLTYLSLASYAYAGFGEYGAEGTIPGVSFEGGGGSYKQAVSSGMTLGITTDFPYTYQKKDKEAAGLDVDIIKEAARRLGIKDLRFELMPSKAPAKVVSWMIGLSQIGAVIVAG